MKLYIWRHNKTYHSHSMINEPCVNSEFYLDALLVVAANSLEEALKAAEKEKKGWRIDDLKELTPTIVELDEAKVAFSELRGNIAHL